MCNGLLLGKNQRIILDALEKYKGEFTSNDMIKMAFPKEAKSGYLSTKVCVVLARLEELGIVKSRLEPKRRRKTRYGVYAKKPDKLIRIWSLDPESEHR